jgi:hypothetical protein
MSRSIVGVFRDRLHHLGVLGDGTVVVILGDVRSVSVAFGAEELRIEPARFDVVGDGLAGDCAVTLDRTSATPSTLSSALAASHSMKSVGHSLAAS